MQKDEKATLVAIMVGCLGLFAFFKAQWLWILAMVVGLAGLLSPWLTHWIHRAWFALATGLGFVTSRLILGVVFIVVLLPIAMLAKIFRRDLMMLKNNRPTYYVRRSHLFQPGDLENPW